MIEIATKDEFFINCKNRKKSRPDPCGCDSFGRPTNSSFSTRYQFTGRDTNEEVLGISCPDIRSHLARYRFLSSR